MYKLLIASASKHDGTMHIYHYCILFKTLKLTKIHYSHNIYIYIYIYILKVSPIKRYIVCFGLHRESLYLTVYKKSSYKKLTQTTHACIVFNY